MKHFKSFNLFGTFSDCPKWWQSFIESTVENFPVGHPYYKLTGRQQTRYLTEIISDDDIVLRDKTEGLIVTFKTEASFVNFVLKWT